MADDGLTRARWGRGGAAALAVMVVGVVAMMIVPLPTPLLDVLITINLGLAVAILLGAVYSARTLELSTFPTVLVLTTLYRLSLNVSTVRLILAQADAGRVIHAFGSFVVRGDYVVGFAVFLILTIVQYVVISRGAERVAEVAARFTLDAMPGQQLAIDAELRSGALDTEGARTRRAELKREAQLYGALDGAMRFVKGDAIAGILILIISLVGGLIVGVVQHGMSLGEAARLYTLLTIGDGLVSQLPALLISTAAGLVVTRVASEETDDALGSELARQLFRPRALGVTALLLALLALVPGLPLWPFLLVGAAAGGLALLARRRPETVTPGPSVPQVPAPLEVALAPQLASATPDLDERLARTTRALADELGLLVPACERRVDATLPLGRFEVRLRGVPLSSGVIPEGRLLADAGPAQLPEGVDAEPAEHPGSGALASWVPAAQADQLAAAGLQLFDAAGTIAAALESALRKSAPELIGLDETQRLLDGVQRRYPALVREVVPRRIDTAGLAEVLRRLAAEGVPILDLRDVLEAIARQKDGTTDPAHLTERVRAALARPITHRHAPDRRAMALLLDAEAEEAVRGALRASPDGSGAELALEPDFAETLLASLRRELETLGAGAERAILLTSAELRRHLRGLIAHEHPRLPVLAFHELTPDVEVERVGTLRLY